MDVDGEEEEKICRYCFDGEEDSELISPCKCAGGQKFVHLKCLRQWQRMVLVSQPTHPAFYDRDVRHQTCNVCAAEFTCPPPTRHELMASFTGPEIAALIDVGCIIVSHGAFSDVLKEQLETMPSFVRNRVGYVHWIRGVYLITKVEQDVGNVQIMVASKAMLEKFRERLGDGLSVTLQGRRFKLAAKAALEGVPEDKLLTAFANLPTPSEICLESQDDVNCGDDHVVAMNLTRPTTSIPQPSLVERAVAAVCAKYRGASRVHITHFLGGPCDEDEIMCCVVLGGGGRGWTVVYDLQSAIELAYTRAVKRYDAQGDLCGGQTVRLTGLQACPELNGELAVLLRFNEGSSRWLVRLRNGDGKQLRPANLEPLEGAGGRVFVYWGDARWSRAQLLGEIAKGDWGLCYSNIGDVASAPSECWDNTAGRPVFAPITDMSENYMRDAQREMNATRAVVRMHGNPRADEDEEVTEELLANVDR
eukprot:TRINITY_DN19162_c0_g1_i1.p1 TRINITY_DN19162_c0_g1~~TRINITY_DN19162_c0_g1_i1.p1  ORF type:complete len:477 (+),score=96.16 TRINITY_DN19162_c0_g1_i1:79-1509(+)